MTRPTLLRLAGLALGATSMLALLSLGRPVRSGGLTRVYQNRLTRVQNPKPLLADYPEFIAPINDQVRFEAPTLVDDPGANLSVRAWRWSYNARAIIEVPNRLRAKDTAIICVHPWGIDDGRGWKSPEPAGVAFACTPEKNAIVMKQMRQVMNPFYKSLRGKVGVIAYSLPGTEDSIRKKIYRSYRAKVTDASRREGERELSARLAAFNYKGEGVPETLELSPSTPVIDYFRQFPGIDSGNRYDPAGFWDLPIPVNRNIEVGLDDVVIYDGEGYDALRTFLKSQGIRHVLLTGFHTDMCVRSTCAGHLNLAKDFDVFLVGDCTQATFPANVSPAHATNAAVSYAALDRLITQVSWVQPIVSK